MISLETKAYRDTDGLKDSIKLDPQSQIANLMHSVQHVISAEIAPPTSIFQGTVSVPTFKVP